MNNDVKTPWKITALVVLIALVAIFMSTLLVGAHEFTKSNETTVFMSGDIDAGATKELKAYLENNKKTDTIILSSRGGLFAEGIMLGLLFDEKGLATVVLKNQYCISSCAFAFLGGKKQALNGTLAFHRAYTEDKSLGMNELFGEGQQVGGFTVWYLIKMGYNSQLAYFIQAKTSVNTFFVFTDKALLDMMFVSSDDNTPVSKFLEPTGVSAQWMNDRIKSGGGL